MTTEGTEHDPPQSSEANTVQPRALPHQSRGPRAILGILNRYSYSFALVLVVVLLSIYVLQTRNVNWIGTIATFAPVACAAMASTPAIISGGGGFDVSISPIMVLTTAVYAV